MCVCVCVCEAKTSPQLDIKMGVTFMGGYIPMGNLLIVI
jgi:hypothetical protein